MVCKLPPKLLQAINRFRYCNVTEPVVGTSRTTAYTKVFGGYGRPLKECEDGLRSSMQKAGAKHLGVGVHRRTFGFEHGGEGCVVKVARTTDQGTDANREETRAWKSLPNRARPYFAPVTQADPEGWWEVQPEVETDGSESEIESRLNEVGVSCEDLHSANIGMYKGNPVALDYGYFGFSCRAQRPTPAPLAAETRRRPRRPTGQRSILQFGRRH